MKIVGIGCKQIFGVANKHEVFVLFQESFFDKVFVDTLGDVSRKPLRCFFGGCFCVAKLEAARGFLSVSSVERYDVKMHVQICAATKTLDKNHGSHEAVFCAGLTPQMDCERIHNFAAHNTRKRVGARKPKPKWRRERDDKLSHRNKRDKGVGKVNGSFSHSTSTARWTEASALTRKRHQFFVLALRALHAPKPIGENAAAEIILKLLGDVFGYGSTLHLTLSLEGFPMPSDGLIEKSLFRFSALVCELSFAHFAKEALENTDCRQTFFM
jgi:hypothetical protein